MVGRDNQYPEKRQLITLRLWAQRIIKYYLLSSFVSQLILDLLLRSFTKVHLMVGSFELVMFYTLPTKSNSLSLPPTLLRWENLKERLTASEPLRALRVFPTVCTSLFPIKSVDKCWGRELNQSFLFLLDCWWCSALYLTTNLARTDILPNSSITM